MVQFWFSFGSVGTVSVQLEAEPTLNQLNQNCTKTEPKLNQQLWFSFGSVLVQFWFTWFSFGLALVQFGSVLVQCWSSSVGSVWVQLKAEPKLNQLNQNGTTTEP